MTAGYLPQQGFIAQESQRIADADFSEGDRQTGEDHSAHAAGRICPSCGRTSKPSNLPAAAVKRTGCTTSALS